MSFVCDGTHLVFRSNNYLDLSVEEKFNQVCKLQRCFNCLNKHKISECTKYNNECCICGIFHHYTLHDAKFLKHNHKNNESEEAEDFVSAGKESRSSALTKELLKRLRSELFMCGHV